LELIVLRVSLLHKLCSRLQLLIDVLNLLLDSFELSGGGRWLLLGLTLLIHIIYFKNLKY